MLFSNLICGGISASAQVIKTVGTAGDYGTIKAAFDAINAGALTGQIELQVISSHASPKAILFGSGTGAANYSSVRIYPTQPAITLSASSDLMELNGAANVLVDGRLNGDTTINSSSLTISVSANDAAAIRFINGASYDTVRFCTLRSSYSGTPFTGGVLHFGAASAAQGNSNIVIHNNTITSSTARPRFGIQCHNTTTTAWNENIQITDNLFNNLFSTTLISSSINIHTGAKNWLIEGNSFYETTAFSGINIYRFIFTNDGTGYVIRRNYFGGNQPLAQGRQTYTLGPVLQTGYFAGIFIFNVDDTGDVARIDGNIFRGLSFTNNANLAETRFDMIRVESNVGNITIGTEDGNLIGSESADENIIVTNTANQRLSLNGILTTSASGAIINHNITVENNKIKGLYLNHVGVNPVTQCAGIASGYRFRPSSPLVTAKISDNEISDIRVSTDLTTASSTGFAAGIYHNSETTCEVSRNKISGISHLSQGNASGIEMELVTFVGKQTIRDNFISGISGIKSKIYGINLKSVNTNRRDTVGRYINNLIVLNDTASNEVYGIYNNHTNISNIFLYNTVYLSGEVKEPSIGSAALYSGSLSRAATYNSNLLVNARSNTEGGNGTHYSILMTSATPPVYINYNNYFTTGIGGVLGKLSTNDYSTLAAWKEATGQDCFSYNENPGFLNAGTDISTDYLPSNVKLKANENAVDQAGNKITKDIIGNSRSASKPAIGALEYNIIPASGTLYFNFYSSHNSILSPGDIVTINGQGFSNVSSVNFNGVSTTYSVISATQVQAVVPVVNIQMPITIKVLCGSVADSVSGSLYLATLPVGHISFSAIQKDNNHALLSWRSYSEINLQHYEVERSIDGISFEQKGQVTPNGSENRVATYFFTDKLNAFSRQYYYRLKIVDKDESYSYSSVVALKASELNITGMFNVYPNPFISNFKIDYYSNVNQNATITVRSIEGKLIESRVMEIRKGNNIIRMNVSDQLSKGLYLIELQTEEGKFIRKLLKN